MSGVTVRVRYLGTIAAELGCREEGYTLSGPASVGGLISSILERHGKQHEAVFLSRDGRALALAFLDGRAVGRDSPLAGGETVSFVSLVSGG